MRRIAMLVAVISVFLLSGQIAVAQEGSGALVIDRDSLADLSLLLPRLFAVDELGRLIPATANNGGLVESWTVEYGDFSPDTGRETRVTFQLRRDAFWSDGTPINAFDVFQSIERKRLGFRDGIWIGEWLFVTPTSEDTLVMIYSGETCAALEALGNLPVTPANRSDPSYSDVMELMAAEGGSPEQQYTAAQRLFFDMLPGPDADSLFELTAPRHTFVEDTDEYDRYRLGDLALTIETSRSGDRLQEVNDFISGQLDVIINPPLVYRSDLRAVPGIQIVEQVGRSWYVLGFNFADPAEPASAFDESTGAPQEQKPHPLFSDLRMRQAIRLALDVDALGAAATAGHHTPLASDQLPWSWAYNPDLLRPEHDPFEAVQILDALRWRDWDGNGVRECQGCATAETGQPFWFSLFYDEVDPQQIIVARGIQEQLDRIDVAVELVPYNGYTSVFGHTSSQTFDAYLLGITERSPFSADRALLYRQSEDRLNGGNNVTSYVNPALEDAFDRAAHAPNCDYEARAEALREASAIIYHDIPYLPLFAVNDFYAAQAGVGGFAPRQNDPFWNLADWVVNR